MDDSELFDDISLNSDDVEERSMDLSDVSLDDRMSEAMSISSEDMISIVSEYSFQEEKGSEALKVSSGGEILEVGEEPYAHIAGGTHMAVSTNKPPAQYRHDMHSRGNLLMVPISSIPSTYDSNISSDNIGRQVNIDNTRCLSTVEVSQPAIRVTVKNDAGKKMKNTAKVDRDSLVQIIGKRKLRKSRWQSKEGVVPADAKKPPPACSRCGASDVSDCSCFQNKFLDNCKKLLSKLERHS